MTLISAAMHAGRFSPRFCHLWFYRSTRLLLHVFNRPGISMMRLTTPNLSRQRPPSELAQAPRASRHQHRPRCLLAQITNAAPGQDTAYRQPARQVMAPTAAYFAYRTSRQKMNLKA